MASRTSGQVADDSPELCLRQASALLSERGASEVRSAEEVFLIQGESWERPIGLVAGECRSWLGIAGGDLEDLDLRVLDSEGHVLAEDMESDVPPRVRVCAEQDVSIIVRALAFRGSGPALIATWRGGAEDVLEELGSLGSCFAGAASPPARVSDLGPIPRARTSQVSGRADGSRTEWISPRDALFAAWAGRGVEPSALQDSRLGDGRVLDTHVAVPVGRCAAIGAASHADDDAEHWVDIAVVDHRGERVGWDLRRRGWASVYTCGREGETLRVRIRGRGPADAITLYSAGAP